MYYLRKEPYEQIIPEIKKTDGTVIESRKYMTEDRAIYKNESLSRFYRGEYKGSSGKYQGMEVYKCENLKDILELQKSTMEYCGELFDVYDEDGKVKLN